MPDKTKSITLDLRTLFRICDALNAQAATFETQADFGNQLPKDTCEVLRNSARDNRSLTKSLLEQWEKKPLDTV